MRLCRLLLEIDDTLVLACEHKSEAACLVPGNGVRCDRNIGIVSLMKIEQNLVVHLVDVVTAKDQDILGIVALDEVDVLVDRICRAGVPLGVTALLIGRKDADAAVAAVKIPRDTDADVDIEAERLILRQNADSVDT